MGDVVKEEKSRERQRADPAVLDSNSPLVVSIVFSARETMLNVSEPEHPSTWPLRSSSWPVTPLVTTRRPGSSPVTCNWPSVTTKIEQIVGWSHHCPRRCPPQHPSCPSPQEDRKESLNFFFLKLNYQKKKKKKKKS